MAKEETQHGARFRIGITVLIVSWCSPLLIPLVTASSLSTEWKAVLSGALALGIPEVGTLAAVAIMGKSGYDVIKRRIFDFLKQVAPPERVSLNRYRIGLIMFTLPLLFGWLEPYLRRFAPQLEAHWPYPALAGDLMFVASFFVLGGEFWDKIRSLFLCDARAILRKKPLAD